MSSASGTVNLPPIRNTFVIQSGAGRGGGMPSAGIDDTRVSMPRPARVRDTTGAMNGLSDATKKSAVQMKYFDIHNRKVESRLTGFSRGIRRARGQMLGFFFSTLFLTMGMQRLRDAEKKVTEAEKEFGEGSEEAKAAEQRRVDMLRLVQIQQGFLAVQILETTLQLVANRRSIWATLSAMGSQILGLKATKTTFDDETLTIKANTLALGNNRRARLALGGTSVVGAGARLALPAATGVGVGAGIGAGAGKVISAARGAGAAAAGAGGAIGTGKVIDATFKVIKGGARGARGVATIGLGIMMAVMMGIMHALGYYDESERMQNLPTFQTFSGQRKVVPRDMPIFAHAGEVISRPSNNSTVNNSGGNTVVVNNKIIMSPRGDSPEVAAEKFIRKQVNIFKGTYM